MKKNIALLLLLLLILAGCSSEQQEPQKEKGPVSQAPFTSIPAHTAQELMKSKSDLVILDVRTSQEILRHGALAGSRQTSLRAIFQDQLTMAKETPIMVVCAVGGRSYAAGQIMVRQGFQEIYNLRGGLDEWKRAALPVVYPKK